MAVVNNVASAARLSQFQRDYLPLLVNCQFVNVLGVWQRWDDLCARDECSVSLRADLRPGRSEWVRADRRGEFLRFSR
jgi:hypothetical protein